MMKYARGVTLIELMVVVVIISILMSIAIPSYRQYTLRANRAEAKSMLMQTAANQERFYLEANTYATNAQLTAAPPNGLGMQAESDSGNYSLEITAADATGFTAVTEAQEGQTDDEECLVFAVDERGTRYGGPGPAFDDNNDPDCW